MKKTSEEVADHLHTMEDKLGSLKHRQLLGFQTDVYSTEKQKYVLLNDGILGINLHFCGCQQGNFRSQKRMQNTCSTDKTTDGVT